ncbi:MAG TPA: glycosyltransferase family 39 protein [Verrucomicrobiae bacterium]|nr:glycosyltransferase family 39 protein [Verrucomicrobiae bacterium]
MQIQDMIHEVEQGGGIRLLKRCFIGLALLLLFLSYNVRQFKNMSNPEAMDAAQVARNLAEGKGFTTLFIRPLSLYLVQKAYDERHGPAPLTDMSDRCELRGMHPDLANAPVYPAILAGMMKVIPPLRYQNAGSSRWWNQETWTWTRSQGGFWVYAPDFCISLFNQALFLTSVVMLYFLARQLFDIGVARTSAVLFLGTDLFWRFSISGLSTMLLILILLGIAWGLMRLERNARDEKWGPADVAGAAAGIGALVAIGALTRYSFGWLIVPVVLFLAVFLGRNRSLACFAALSVFALLMTPWIIRNYSVSHTLFGTAGFAVFENTYTFPDFELQRSLHPDLGLVQLKQFWFKLLGNVRTALQDDLPKLGGNWITAFFLAGLLVNFRNQSLNRLRWFVIFCLPILLIVQCLGRTSLSERSPGVNSENLLVLLMPLIIIFGVSFFFTLLEQMNLPLTEIRFAVICGFCLIMCLPMIFTLFSPRVSPIAHPPYYPPLIQKTSSWVKPEELVMSDIPWAVAWYGERQCAWLTLNADREFYEIYDFKKPIEAVYLTPETLDERFLSDWSWGREKSWGKFVFDSLSRGELPAYFPLRKTSTAMAPGHMFLSNHDRWRQTAAAPR